MISRAIRDLQSPSADPENAVMYAVSTANMVLAHFGDDSCIRQVTDEIVMVHK